MRQFAKAGRRAQQASKAAKKLERAEQRRILQEKEEENKVDVLKDEEEEEEEEEGLEEEEEGPPKVERGGWGEPGEQQQNKQFEGISKRKKAQMNQEGGADRGNRNRAKYAEEKETVLDIRELEDEGKEDLMFKVAEAPKYNQYILKSLQEIEEETGLRFPFGNVVGEEKENPEDMDSTDLSVLTTHLLPSAQVEEEDVEWKPQQLLLEIASMLRQDDINST
eukprot:TRINITY_DN4466_c0_g1_i5.p1 TRINITY_DN4466_c0_g1~~TRINITY_DN4466_c0_g1_i5.p1  ORF type:complete len:222 (+),score=78.38 TRINITY_DN4466_c0_g1_i5:53-718(+)